MAKFSLSEINSLQQQYWGEALVPINNTALDQAYWGQVQGIQSEELDRYWIGGASGDETNWHNAANWASSSGGTGGAGVPTELNNVYFDSNSNGYACVATAAMVCKYLNGVSGWTNNFDTAGYSLTVGFYINITTTGTITFTNSTIYLGGNLTISSALTAYNCAGVTWHFKATGIYSVSKAQSDPYKKATIYSGVTLSVLIGVFTFRDDGASGLITLADSTATLRLTGGSISITANGSVTPVVDNGGTISASTGYSCNILTTTTGSIIGVPKITSGTNLLLTLKSTGNITATYNMTAPIICRQVTIEALGADALTFNTNNYDISVPVWILGQSNVITPSNLTINCGSSVIIFNGTATYNPALTIQQQGSPNADILNINMQDSQWVVKQTGAADTVFSFSGSGTRNVTYNSTATFTLDTVQNCTLTCAGVTLPRTIVKIKAVLPNTYYTRFTDALNCASFKPEPGSIIQFKEGVTHVIGSYTSGDWNGTAVNLVTIKSVTDTQQHTLSVPTGINVSYVDVRDSVASQKINAFLTNGCVNSGNTSNWVFVGGAWFLLASRNELYRSRNI